MTHIHAKTHLAPPPPPPPVHHTEHAAQVNVTVSKDKSRVTGALPRLSQAKTQPLQALPWDSKAPQMDGWMGALRAGFLNAWHQTTQDRTQSVVNGLKGKLTKEGEAALKTLESNGTLTKGWLGHTVLDRLQKFLDHGGNKHAESAALEEIADPSKIQQARPDTCAAADMQRNLATERPAKYIAVVNHLLKDGKFKLDGHEFSVSPENMAAIKSMHLKGPALVNAMFQAAAMDAANGRANYNIKSDTTTYKSHGHEVTQKGLSADSVKNLDQWLGDAPTVTPKDVHKQVEALVKQGIPEAQAKQQVLESELSTAKAAGHQGVIFAVKDTRHHLAHAVIVTGVANGEVTFVDGHQRSHTVPEADFVNHLCTNEKDRIGSGITFGQSGPSSTSYYAPPPYGAMPWH